MDKLKIIEETLLEIKEIHRKGFDETAHPKVWRDLEKVMTRVDMLLKIVQS